MARGKREPGTSWERRDRSQEVIDAAIQVFYDKGYADASMQDVADRVGVLKGSLYHYISSKEELLFGILSTSHAEAVQITDAVEGFEGSSLDRLASYLRLMAEWYLTHIERVSIYFKESDQLTGDRLKQVQAQQRATERYLRKLLTAAQDDGFLREDRNLRMSSLMVFGQMNSFPDWYRPDGPFSLRSVVDTFIDWTLSALGADAATATAASLTMPKAPTTAA